MGIFSKLLNSTLLTPERNVTKINREDFWNLDEHIKPGDRIAWHRSYMLIHEAIVLKVDAEKRTIWVFERTKEGSSSSSSSSSSQNDDAPWGPGIAKITKVDLTATSLWAGQLYRYNDSQDSLSATLKRVLSNLDTRGYNLFALNCQHSASGVQTDGKGTSHQTRWFFITQTVNATGIPLLSEVLERYCSGAEWIGIVSAGVLHATAFVVELIAAILKYRRGHMSWDDFATVVSRQLFMHVVGWFGNYLSSFSKGRMFLQVTGILPMVLAFFFAIIADALFLYYEGDPDSWWRYIFMAVAAIPGFMLGIAATGSCLEFLVSMILGFVGMFVGHGLHFAGSWLLEWLKSEKFKGQYVKKSSELEKGDHITTYDRWCHPHCHAIFDEFDNHGQMKIIRNAHQKGVIEEIVPFCNNWVYRYDYPPEARSGDDVVRIAKSKVDSNLSSNNCKAFAEDCKLLQVSSNSNNIDWKVHYDVIMSDVNISKDNKKKFKKKFKKMQKCLSKQCTDEHTNTQNVTNPKKKSPASDESRGKRRSIRVVLRSLVCM